LLKSIQKWLHNNFLKKYGFGWLYRDFFTFPNTFDRWLYMWYINLSCLNKENSWVKLKNCSCVFISTAWTNSGDHFVSLFACFIVFSVSDLRKLALSTTLHPKSLVKKLQCVPIDQKKITMCLFLCSIKIRSQLKHTK
jgi:hypothetical protein